MSAAVEIARRLRRAYAHTLSTSDKWTGQIVADELRAIGRLVLGEGFDVATEADATCGAAPFGDAPHERPSARYIDDCADDAQRAG